MASTKEAASPVGEDSWLAYIEEALRTAEDDDLENRVKIIELYTSAVAAEPGSLKLWRSYCEYFWTLYSDCHDPECSWPASDKVAGSEIFSLDASLHLWQQGADATKYRLSDSHELWDRWISLENEQLVKTRTAEGIKRITHLYRNRLRVPHMTWDETSQSFSTFLSEHSRDAWEDTMQEITREAQEAKRLIQARDPFETRLAKATASGDKEAYRTTFKEYLEWEMAQSKRNNDRPEIGFDMCCGLYDRALTGIFALDDGMWHEYVVYLSTSRADLHLPRNLLGVLQRAVKHCPWSGGLWARYILTAEEAKLSFSEVSDIKHTATSSSELVNYGMTSLLDVYVAWCGFLKRTAMDPKASDDDVDVADVGLNTALEDVELEGKRRYGRDYKGDPEFRLERIYVQYLTEKKGSFDEARAQWKKMASRPLHADSYDFWLRYYMWEILAFSSEGKRKRSPTPGSSTAELGVPTLATAVLVRAINRHGTLDWPERVMEVYLQHCNDYESPSSVRSAVDYVYNTRKKVAKRRERESSQAAAAYAQAQSSATNQADSQASPLGSKRKREHADADAPEDTASKRAKTEENGVDDQASAKRDRENTSVIVTNLPADVTQTKIKQYFKSYGHINSLSVARDAGDTSSTALIEFRSFEDAESALLRDGKYFGESQINVCTGHNHTLYVTNFPPEADEAYIRDLFSDCGDILSIRWPSLKYNTHRRFCYVSFRDLESAAKATQKDGTALKGSTGKFKLLAKYSNPGKKKQREGAVAEGRELYVRNIGQGCSEEDLGEVFGKYGTVSNVNMPKSMAGKPRGFAYVVFDTKDVAAEAAKALDKTTFRGKVLEVEVSREKNFKISAKSVGAEQSPSPAPTHDDGDEEMPDATTARKSATSISQEDIDARTIVLLDLPDTVNDARVRSLVESVGPIAKLVLHPGRGTAKIEFGDAATAGKASLHFDGYDFEGHKLRTSGVEELKGQKVNSKGAAPKTKSFAPLAAGGLRRPGTLGGPKRGLGFTRSQNEGEKSDKKGEKQMKSNADFRALISSGSSKVASSSRADSSKGS